jgi:hypothetical protein
VGRLWRGHNGRRHAGAGEEERGVLVLFSSSPPFSMAWVGAEGTGLDRGTVQEHGYSRRANGDSDPHSEFDLLDFHLPGVRRNARKKFKFEILKISSLGDRHIGQGFQSYFCYREMLGFAEILFAFLGIVTVSDSNFG